MSWQNNIKVCSWRCVGLGDPKLCCSTVLWSKCLAVEAGYSEAVTGVQVPVVVESVLWSIFVLWSDLMLREGDLAHRFSK